ncbi:MAG: hypothetical protein NZ734_06265 [Paracoccus sp.]|nr:hypothetical protein [Paracoccus sp. (in: a-proteobacteria)]
MALNITDTPATTDSVFRCASCRDHYHSEDAAPGLCPICNPAEQARDQMLRMMIAEQNDAFRRALGFAALWRGQHLKGRTVATPGFLAIPERTQGSVYRHGLCVPLAPGGQVEALVLGRHGSGDGL